ncbi:MAG: SDR family oxidoreductase [Trueperaceae bacterium]|nr:SDR family oxidoreductase [Trueperaceae bacterium]
MSDFVLTNDRLDDKVFIVTGSTQGLGEFIARRIAHLGAQGIVVCGRKTNQGEQVAAELTSMGVKSIFVKADLAVEADCRTITQRCDETFGRVDGLVNAAGLSSRGHLDDTTVELWDKLFKVNTRAPFILMQETARIMKREGIRGSIVNIITMGAYGGPPVLMAYCSSKGALSILTKNVAQTLLTDHIRVNGINIGWMETPGEHEVQKAAGQPENWLELANASRPFGRLLHPKDIAPMVTYLLSDQAQMMTGSIIDLDQTIHGPYPD